MCNIDSHFLYIALFSPTPAHNTSLHPNASAEGAQSRPIGVGGRFNFISGLFFSRSSTYPVAAGSIYTSNSIKQKAFCIILFLAIPIIGPPSTSRLKACSYISSFQYRNTYKESIDCYVI